MYIQVRIYCRYDVALNTFSNLRYYWIFIAFIDEHLSQILTNNYQVFMAILSTKHISQILSHRIYRDHIIIDLSNIYI